MDEKSIKKIICGTCGGLFEFFKEIKDVYNSDFYEALYKCVHCNYAIKITTKELRD